MKKFLIIAFYLCLAVVLPTAGQEVADSLMDCTATVVDSDSGEPLSMVGIYITNDNTTLTNFDGEFAIKAGPDDKIRLTCIGRQTLYIKASELPDTIRMKMLPGTLSEVTVYAYDKLLMQISQKMEKSFNRRQNKTAQYFYRQTQVVGWAQDVVEAFVHARSAINLRNLQFLSGRHGQVTRDKWENSIFNNMNLHHVLELGAMTLNVPFWNQLLTPLIDHNNLYPYLQPKKAKLVTGLEYYQLVYHIDVEEVNSDDQRLFRIHLTENEEAKLIQPVMTGTLYVDRKTLQTLSFEGELKNVTLVFTRSELESATKVPVDLHVHIDYRHDHGYPEVSALSMQASFDNFQTRTMVFNVEDQRYAKVKRSKRTLARENMIASIDEAGYDSTFWAQNEVIKRTAEEQLLAEGRIEEVQARMDSIRAVREALPPLERLADRLKRFGEAIPQEKVYLHMDNTCYFLGDTLWFAAHARRTNDDKPSRISRVLYVELLNHDGYLVERKLVEMRDGRGHGFFALPDTLYSGFFELRAYTRWQLNWGQTEHPHIKNTERSFYSKDMAKDYFCDYEKLYSRVFPVYDKPKEAGEFVRDMTLRPMRRQFRKEATPPRLTLSLFPEGGNLVAGVPNRVAFEAALEDGEVREGCLSLTLPQGEGTLRASTENRGRGTFCFTPQAGQTYEVVFTATEDSAVVRQKIKDIQPEGVALQVRREDDKWVFDLHSTLDKPLGMTIMHEGVTQYFDSIDAQPNFQFSIFNFQLPLGVNQVTVFDEEGRVWADRLFFVTRTDMAAPTLTITGLKDKYEPYEQMDLGIQCSTAPSSSVSLSIRDRKNQDNTFDSGNILTEMLLSSEIKGFVPQPEWYFERDDEEHRRGLDLLMMTQGWRRFSWHDMAVRGAWELTHPAEHTQMVTGSVNAYYVDDLQKDDNQETIENFQAFQDDPMKKRDGRSFGDGNNIIGQQDFDRILNAGKSFITNNHNDNRQNDKFLKAKGLKHEAVIHAEFVPIGGGKGLVGETTTKGGTFKIDLPRFYGDCVFYLTAADTTGWHKKHPLWAKKFKQHTWIQMEDDEWERIHEDAEFYVRLRFSYPRWVKPYTYYQVHHAAAKDEGMDQRLLTDGTHLLNEVTIRSKRNRLRRLDLHKPVYVIDAYEAGNAAMDAGLITKLHSGDTDSMGNWGLGNTSEIAMAVVTNYIGDMNLDRRYDYDLYYDSLKYESWRPNAAPENSYWVNQMVSPLDKRQYSRLEYIDKIYLYSDYSPRREGDERYEQSNQPSVGVSLHCYPNRERRVTYRDRRYILHGFAVQEDFYHPNYKRNPPQEGQKDYRRTLYWNPEVKLNAEGKAQVRCYNNSQQTRVCIETAGQSPDGTLLFNK